MILIRTAGAIVAENAVLLYGYIRAKYKKISIIIQMIALRSNDFFEYNKMY